MNDLKWLNEPNEYSISDNCITITTGSNLHSKIQMQQGKAMPHSDTVKIGIEAQCPVGEGATHEVLYFSVEEKSIDDLRKIQ